MYASLGYTIAQYCAVLIFVLLCIHFTVIHFAKNEILMNDAVLHAFMRALIYVRCATENAEILITFIAKSSV